MVTTSTTGSMGNADPAAAAGDSLNRTAQSAHAMVDRVAEKAAPAVDRLHQGIDSASEALQSGVHNLDEMQERWLETSRDYVRENPLLSIGIAVAAGLLLSRLMAR